eukprot:61265-Chlamydomonas_euryale.AAC.5
MLINCCTLPDHTLLQPTHIHTQPASTHRPHPSEATHIHGRPAFHSQCTPSCSRARSTSARCAVPYTTGTAAAASRSMPSGSLNTAVSGTDTWSTAGGSAMQGRWPSRRPEPKPLSTPSQRPLNPPPLQPPPSQPSLNPNPSQCPLNAAAAAAQAFLKVHQGPIKSSALSPQSTLGTARQGGAGLSGPPHARPGCLGQGESAAHRDRDDTFAWLDAPHAGPRRRHHAGHLGARHKREWRLHLVQALSGEGYRCVGTCEPRSRGKVWVQACTRAVCLAVGDTPASAGLVFELSLRAACAGLIDARSSLKHARTQDMRNSMHAYVRA